MLWDPEAHEPLVEQAWDEERVRATIRAIAGDAEKAFARGWPIHPRDAHPEESGPYAGLYLGGAGVVDGLRRLAARGLVESGRDYVPYVEQLEPDYDDAGLWFGETGVVLVLHRLTPSTGTQERLRELVASNVGDERREVMGEPRHDARRARARLRGPLAAVGGAASRRP